MTPKDYEYLLVAANLAHFHKRWGFIIKMTKLKLFLEGHRFTTINCDGTFEFDSKKIDLNAFIQGESAKHRESLYFIRIGVLKASSHRKNEMQKDPHDGHMITSPQYSKQREMVLMNNNEQEELIHHINESTLKDLNVHHNRLVEKLKRACRTLADQQLKLKGNRDRERENRI